jgi:radical SAM superfamily enzyme YgiQ (UPF0313 family)
MSTVRVTLVDNLVFPDPTQLKTLDVHPHLGLLSIAAVANARGHVVSVFDPKRLVRSGELAYDDTLYESSAATLVADAPDVIGFTTLGCSFLYTLGVARELKRMRPDLPILLGGPHATMLARPILERYPVFDVVVRHEAEPTFASVLSGLGSWSFRDIPGVSWRLGREVHETPGAPRVDDLDALPWLDYDAYPIAELNLDLMRVEAGRGCPFACTFCSTATFFQRRYRLKSPARVVAEMDYLRSRYAPREFKLDHDLFTVDKRKVKAFCDEVRGHRHRWHVSARADCVDDDLLRRMADAGCVGLYLGVETGSARMQKISAKRLDLNLVEPTLNTCERLGIRTTASFITGYPEETAIDQANTLDMLGRCFRRPESSCLPQLHLLTPEPGTGLFAEYGTNMRLDGHATRFNSWLLDPSDEAEIQAAPGVFATYYHYPGIIDRRDHVFAVEAVDRLRQLGHDVLSALIERTDGSLAALVGRLAATSGDVPTREDVERLVLDRFGQADPLTSVVRYRLFCATPCPEPAEPGRPPSGQDVYRSPAGLQCLPDILDIDRALAEMTAHGTTPSAPRYTYLRWPAHQTPVRLDPPIADLVRSFGSGRSLTTTLAALDEDPRVIPDWVQDLEQMGLLEPVSGTRNIGAESQTAMGG